MEITKEKEGKVIILQLIGRFDAGTSGEFESKVKDSIETDDTKMAIDFTNLEYINSSGLRVVLMTAKQLNKKGGKLALFAMKEHIKEIFDMTGFSTIIPVYKTREEAVKSL